MHVIQFSWYPQVSKLDPPRSPLVRNSWGSIQTLQTEWFRGQNDPKRWATLESDGQQRSISHDNRIGRCRLFLDIFVWPAWQLSIKARVDRGGGIQSRKLVYFVPQVKVGSILIPMPLNFQGRAHGLGRRTIKSPVFGPVSSSLVCFCGSHQFGDRQWMICC